MSRYRNPAMKQLTDQQVKYAPKHVRLTQIDKAERLLDRIDPKLQYAYREICEHVTSYQTDRFPDLVLSGEEAAHDLRCFVEDLSDSANLSVDSVPEPVLTIQDVSNRYNVSTKTVDRWRNRGLVSRRFKIGSRKRIGFLESSVERFVSKHADDVSRGRAFRQLTDADREDVIAQARRLARYGASMFDVSRRLSRKLGRSVETIRYTLRNYDKKYPESAVFPNASEPLSDAKKNEIHRSFRRGVPVGKLAAQFGRTKTSIYRVVSEVRTARLLEQPIDFMDSDDFVKPGAEDVILGPPPERDTKASKTKAPPGLPPYLASLYSIPLLTREDEAYYFRKMNYLKMRAANLRDELNMSRPRARDMDEIERLLEESLKVKNFLIRSNLRLVVSIAKRHVKPKTNFFEMVSDGNMSLIRAIEKFDYTQGNKFSTYASWAIMRNFARSIPAENLRLDRFRTGNDEIFHYSSDDRANQFQEEMVNQQQHQMIVRILDQLEERERAIVVMRFGLAQGTEYQTLQQVGNHFGVTKERIRQIEARALRKAREIAEEKRLDIPGGDWLSDDYDSQDEQS